MTNILRLDASIKPAGSISRRLTDRILARLTAAQPAATVTSRDLASGLPAIDAAWIGAIFTPADARSTEQAAIAAVSDTLIAEVKAADVVVIGLPIYNFGTPASLKTWFDHIARKGETFAYTEAGPQGLLTGKRAIIALSSDGTRFGSEIDFASGYVRHMLGFLGITDVDFVAADAMVFGAEEALAKAEGQVDALAA
ncbi:FMN-dependent NADH-azoreductase [Frigidibacter sp.]|uniref:FMN-dependent NADH-azoreductase n=1 Tax=Frigidibacter sp. TaxID=2586418 RepID=UPI0027333F24|nr:NAD(P)H-dependent oxidoreductase [Frigidibacter sp.]MDP3338963.1 NAD(P)H-dependent oxidoreductase [Frigidibacter sp.]